MSGTGDVMCEGWLRKSPPEKKLRRYAWKKRWFVLRSGRLSGEPDILQYYKNQHSRRPIGTINLNLCEQVDAGLSFTKKELESSFVFDLRTEERTWYLVAESEEDMNRWVTSICLLCGFNPTDDERRLSSSSASASVTGASSTPSVAMVMGSVPPPYDPVRVRHLEHESSVEDDYLFLSNCQSHSRPSLGSSASLETDCNDNLYPPPSATSGSSSSSSSPSIPPNSLPPPSQSGFRIPWTVATMTGPLSQSLDAGTTPDFLKRAGKPSAHPRKHSLDFPLRPLVVPLSDDLRTNIHQSAASSAYQIPRPASTPQPPPPRRPSSTPSVDSLTQAELHTSIPPPPPRPPKPPTFTALGDSSAFTPGSGYLPRANSEPERKHESTNGGVHPTKGGEFAVIPRSGSDRATMFDFSESFNSYFFNKGMVPLGGSEDEDIDDSYVPMSAAATEPPVAPRVSPAAPSDASIRHQEENYVPMTPLTSSLPAPPFPPSSDLAVLGRQVPPPAHMGFRSATMLPVAPSTPPLRRNTMNNGGLGEAHVVPPPIHRNLKPQRKVKPAPLDFSRVPPDWQEVPPPIRSPVTRTFTRGPSSRRSVRPSPAHSSSPSSDSDEADESYVTMTSKLSYSAAESSLRQMVHRGSEGGVSSPLLQRAKGEKQVEYLDLDLHTGRSTPPRQKRCTEEGGADGGKKGGASEERARGEGTRVDYVVVDPKRTKALKNTREAWHDGRMSTEKS